MDTQSPFSMPLMKAYLDAAKTSAKDKK
jgi:hypothetical protein